jgi:hypothetical protein
VVWSAFSSKLSATSYEYDLFWAQLQGTRGERGVRGLHDKPLQCRSTAHSTCSAGEAAGSIHLREDLLSGCSRPSWNGEAAPLASTTLNASIWGGPWPEGGNEDCVRHHEPAGKLKVGVETAVWTLESYSRCRSTCLHWRERGMVMEGGMMMAPHHQAHPHSTLDSSARG